MGKLKGKITQAASHAYSAEKIVDKSFNGTHNGEDMRQIFNHIMTSPYINHEPVENSSRVNMVMEGEMIGWYDTQRMMGDIDQKAYDKLKALEAKESEPRPELVSEESFNAMKNTYNENKDAVRQAMRENPDNKYAAAASIIMPEREVPEIEGDDDDIDDEADYE